MKHLLSLALMGAGACALCVMPSFQKHPLQRKFFHRCFAHRGLFDNQTRCENSLSAFEAAAQAGYGIELDLQMTADGKIVVFHDDDLQRMCSSPLVIEQATYAQLQEYNLGETFDKIPLFSQVLAQVNGRVPLIVEIKSTEQLSGRLLHRIHEPTDYGLVCQKRATDHARAAGDPHSFQGQPADCHFFGGVGLHDVQYPFQASFHRLRPPLCTGQSFLLLLQELWCAHRWLDHP